MVEQKMIQLLGDKALFKQQIYQKALKQFDELNECIDVISAEVGEQFKNQEGVRCEVDKTSDQETRFEVGSDILFFHLHTNVFRLAKNHPLRLFSYIQEDEHRAYFCMVNVYNFLADSFLYNRTNDRGQLVARIMFNDEGHFYTEGAGPFSHLFRSVHKQVLSKEVWGALVNMIIVHSINDELRIGPLTGDISLQLEQVQELSHRLSSSTSKSLGFRIGEGGEEN